MTTGEQDSLTERIARTVHDASQAFEDWYEANVEFTRGYDYERNECLAIAGAVVAALGLAEEWGVQIDGEEAWPDPGTHHPNGEPLNDYRMHFWAARGVPIHRVRREVVSWTGPWLPVEDSNKEDKP